MCNPFCHQNTFIGHAPVFSLRKLRRDSMISLYKRGSVFWTRRCEFGREIRESLHTRDREVAKALLRRMELDILSDGRLREVLWPEFQDEFLAWVEPQVRPSTIRGYRITAKRFGRFLEAQRIPQVKVIAPSTIGAFLEERKSDVHPSTGRHPGPGGIKFDLRCLRRIFNYAMECGYMTANPIRQRNLNPEGGHTLPFTDEEVKKMLAAAKDARLRAILLMFLYTGLRISDITTLTKKSVAGPFLVRQTIKRRKVVSLPIHASARKALDEYFDSQNEMQKGSPFLFVTSSGNIMHNIPKVLRSFWKRCGIERGHAHRFRDTFAVRLLKQGASIYDVSKLMGINVQTCERHYAPWVLELQTRAFSLMESVP
jgi:site-specific recombinase XerD